MTASVEDILSVARSQLGYQETGGSSGHDGNITKYWAALDPELQGQPWCLCFQDWVDQEAKAVKLPITDPYYCPSAVTYAKGHDLWNADGRYSAGDMVFFDFTGSGMAEHVGRVVSDDGVNIHTIEGNTLPQDGGDQADGGGVYAKIRPHGSYVLGVLQYSKLLDHVKAVGVPPRKPLRSNPFPEPHHNLHEGDRGEDVKFVQWAVGCPVDGIFGPQTKHGVAMFQQHHHKCGPIDGVVGPETLAVLKTIKH